MGVMLIHKVMDTTYSGRVRELIKGLRRRVESDWGAWEEWALGDEGYRRLWDEWKRSGFEPRMAPVFNLGTSSWMTLSEQRRRVRMSRVKSGVIGVSFCPGRARPWRVMFQGKHRGVYATKEEAARAYDRMAGAAYGAAAKLNYPNDAEPSKSP